MAKKQGEKEREGERRREERRRGGEGERREGEGREGEGEKERGEKERGEKERGRRRAKERLLTHWCPHVWVWRFRPSASTGPVKRSTRPPSCHHCRCCRRLQTHSPPGCLGDRDGMSHLMNSAFLVFLCLSKWLLGFRGTHGLHKPTVNKERIWKDVFMYKM